MNKFSLENLKQLKDELEHLVSAPNKVSGRERANRLLLKANNFEYENAYDKGKLKEAIRSAQEASGRSPAKTHWIGCYRSSWYVFENNIKSHIRDLDTKKLLESVNLGT